MDQIKIGLDFGTHQTKICVQRTPDEGHGEPNYEFFQFTDLHGEKQYFLPSIIQINEDDTLSYGYVDETRIKEQPSAPEKPKVDYEEEFSIEELAVELYQKYSTEKCTSEDVEVLKKMLSIRLNRIRQKNSKKYKEAEVLYESQLREYQSQKNSFRYFKQAAFIGGEWFRSTIISYRTQCVWYLAYVIFLLEEKYGTNFSINMGVPTDDKKYEVNKRLAVEILATAYFLVENVYNNDFDKFLNEKYDVLLTKTVHKSYTEELKKEYVINIFPEAYASLIALTSKGKLPEGMNLTADIGGGTTDISFFLIENKLPMIYKYWSIPRGLNYLAEMSGFDYSEGNFVTRICQDVIDKYNRKKLELVSNLIYDLQNKIKKETSIPVWRLNEALQDRIIVYSGGGSTFDFLTQEIDTFSDVRVINSSIWNEENIKDKRIVSSLAILLATAYGLSLCKKDEEVELKSYSSLFSHLPRKYEREIPEISKDVC